MSYVIDKFVDEGCASQFYKLKGSKRGFKSFDTYENALIAHYHQSKLADLTLAPRVYSEVGKIRRGKKLTGWGYITEIAKTIVCGGNECGCCDRDGLEDDYMEAINELVSEMEDHGFYFGDCHIGNVGYIIRHGERVLVCIDTGDESISSDDGPCFCLECKKGNNCRA